MAKKRILAVASGGGHWTQLMRLRPAFEGHDVTYVTTKREYHEEVSPSRMHVVHDANRWQKAAMLRLIVQVAIIVLRERPDVVISTGAAPGILAMRMAQLFRSRTIWIDSIANADEMSMSGRMACKHATLCLTQWPHLERPEGPRYIGAVL